MTLCHSLKEERRAHVPTRNPTKKPTNTFIYLLFITQTVSTKGCNTYILPFFNQQMSDKLYHVHNNTHITHYIPQQNAGLIYSANLNPRKHWKKRKKKTPNFARIWGGIWSFFTSQITGQKMDFTEIRSHPLTPVVAFCCDPIFRFP